ncbi:hypothetical protein AB3M89_13270 [Microbacterium sp. 179-I 3D2 NHS]|uniref:hypothetical protein n=1 Tax=Microbacterium sp. 179-I 3D2 NHS TaxID=3235178 RepID=UPI0039A14D3B
MSTARGGRPPHRDQQSDDHHHRADVRRRADGDTEQREDRRDHHDGAERAQSVQLHAVLVDRGSQFGVPRHPPPVVEGLTAHREPRGDGDRRRDGDPVSRIAHVIEAHRSGLRDASEPRGRSEHVEGQRDRVATGAEVDARCRGVATGDDRPRERPDDREDRAEQRQERDRKHVRRENDRGRRLSVRELIDRCREHHRRDARGLLGDRTQMTLRRRASEPHQLHDLLVHAQLRRSLGDRSHDRGDRPSDRRDEGHDRHTRRQGQPGPALLRRLVQRGEDPLTAAEGEQGDRRRDQVCRSGPFGEDGPALRVSDQHVVVRRGGGDALTALIDRPESERVVRAPDQRIIEQQDRPAQPRLGGAADEPDGARDATVEEDAHECEAPEQQQCGGSEDQPGQPDGDGDDEQERRERQDETDDEHRRQDERPTAKGLPDLCRPSHPADEHAPGSDQLQEHDGQSDAEDPPGDDGDGSRCDIRAPVERLDRHIDPILRRVGDPMGVPPVCAGSALRCALP